MAGAPELGDLAQRALDTALTAGAPEAEAFVQDSKGIEIRVYEGEVESLTEGAERGAGVRAWIDGRVGYAYGTDLDSDGLEAIASSAVEAAELADPDEYAEPPGAAARGASGGAGGGAAELPGIPDPQLARGDPPRKGAPARAVEA